MSILDVLAREMLLESGFLKWKFGMKKVIWHCYWIHPMHSLAVSVCRDVCAVDSVDSPTLTREVR